MEKVILGGAIVYLDFALLTDVDGQLGVISYFNRSNSQVRSFGASLTFEKGIQLDKKFYSIEGQKFQTYIQPVVVGKEKFYHAISLNTDLGENILLYEKEGCYERFYDFLMTKFDLPLLKQWGKTLYDTFREEQKVWDRCILIQGENSFTTSIPIGGKDVMLSDLRLSEISIKEADLQNTVSNLLAEKKICISPNRQRKLQFKNMDEYFKEYGSSLVKNLEKDIHPLRSLDGEVHDFTVKGKRLYPQQIAQVNGDVALLENHRYAIINSGMGTGKTLMASCVAESFFVRKWLRSHPDKTLADAYASDSNISYRNIVMCPGHLAEKWAKEINEEIPFAKAMVISDFKQLIKLREHGSKREGKEFFILSKDFCKLSYQSIPTPTKQRKGKVYHKVCRECGALVYGDVCECGSKSFEIRDTYSKRTGMVCPTCGRILIPYAKPNKDVEEQKVLDCNSFSAPNAKNAKCVFCGEDLWQPNVANIGENRDKKWIRATFWANKTHKGKKTIWVHKDHMEEACIKMESQPLAVLDRSGARKYAPAEFIKRYLKGFFDIAIFDEIQDLKGGNTGQGHAMHALIRASRKQLCLTGTIAGGMANHLFYTLYRLEPQRMKNRGFEYKDELQFSEKYGKVERTFEYGGRTDGEFRECCKGKMVSQGPKVKPGISPLIFMDFLLDRTTFLDLSDMSRYLPKLKENVVSVHYETELEEDMKSSYLQVINKLTTASRDKSLGGFALLSTQLQFSLSYLDKPYGLSPIKSPVSGSIVVKPDDYSEFQSVEKEELLLSKEKRLIDIIRKEQAEGRNVVVYAEYTASPETCITYRLKEIIEKYCNLKGKVEVLESSSPAAREREAWMHKKAAEGIKVFITNPRCVSTGLDFCFVKDGIKYNYPTLIFYQLGYSMFVTWQASRRAYRLNQTKECRNYYLAWSGSVQEAVISLIAEKQAATSAIQGKFSTEGLAAMANGVDERMKLAQAMANMDSITGNNLQEMFDVLQQDLESTEYRDYKPMLLYKELVGEEEAPTESFDAIKTGQLGIFDLFETMDDSRSQEPSDTDRVIDTVFVESSVPVLHLHTAKAVGKKKVVSGQLSFF